MSTTWAFKAANFVPVGIERRHLRRASRRPVQRVEAHHHMVLSQIIAEFYLYMLLALHRRQLKVRGSIPYFQRHDFLLFLAILPVADALLVKSVAGSMSKLTLL